MQKDTLQVGVEGFSVSVDIEIPDTMADCATLSKGSEKYQVSKFTRGYRIDLQEGGARQVVREMVAGKSPSMLKDESFIAKVKSAVVAEIAAFNPDTPRARASKPSAPQVVTIDPNKQYSAVEIAALLASVKGVVVATEE